MKVQSVHCGDKFTVVLAYCNEQEKIVRVCDDNRVKKNKASQTQILVPFTEQWFHSQISSLLRSTDGNHDVKQDPVESSETYSLYTLSEGKTSSSCHYQKILIRNLSFRFNFNAIKIIQQTNVTCFTIVLSKAF
jgi:hypothetical protein